MKTIVPFTKDINLDGKVAEITSISLEHEMHLGESGIEGDFIVSGDYKAHEISINRDPFTYRLPFNVDLGESLDRSTLNFDIVDFNYELVDNELLRVNIEFAVEADELELQEEERKIKEELDVTFETPIDIVADPEIEELLDDEERLDEDSKKMILDNIAVDDGNNFTTYHVHIVKDGETVDSICTLYGATMDLVKSYNDIEEVLVGDKLLIPSDGNE